jgi:hypothetical protein
MLVTLMTVSVTVAANNGRQCPRLVQSSRRVSCIMSLIVGPVAALNSRSGIR